MKAYEEFFEGYNMDPEEVLTKTFEEVQGYDDAVIVRNIRLNLTVNTTCPDSRRSTCDYIPNNRVVGISKLARVIEIFGKRLQTQETMTAQIAILFKSPSAKGGCSG